MTDKLTQQIKVNITELTRDLMEEIARLEHRKVADLARLLMETALKHYQRVGSLQELLEDAGVAEKVDTTDHVIDPQGNIEILALRWSRNRAGEWRELAENTFHQTPTDLARDVLEEFLACYLMDEQLLNLGMAKYIALREHGLFDMAKRRMKRVSQATAGKFQPVTSSVVDQASDEERTGREIEREKQGLDNQGKSERQQKPRERSRRLIR